MKIKMQSKQTFGMQTCSCYSLRLLLFKKHKSNKKILGEVNNDFLEKYSKSKCHFGK